MPSIARRAGGASVVILTPLNKSQPALYNAYYIIYVCNLDPENCFIASGTKTTFTTCGM